LNEKDWQDKDFYVLKINRPKPCCSPARSPGEFHVDLYTLPDQLVKMLWDFCAERGSPMIFLCLVRISLLVAHVRARLYTHGESPFHDDGSDLALWRFSVQKHSTVGASRLQKWGSISSCMNDSGHLFAHLDDRCFNL